MLLTTADTKPRDFTAVGPFKLLTISTRTLGALCGISTMSMYTVSSDSVPHWFITLSPLDFPKGPKAIPPTITMYESVASQSPMARTDRVTFRASCDGRG